MKFLKPIYDFDSYSIPIAKAIFRQLDELIFGPLNRILKGEEVLNATESPLARALREGSLQYVDGVFIGKLNVTLTKELRGIGAVYNKTKKAYQLEIARIPQNILGSIASGNVKSKATLQKVEDFLRAIEDREIKAPNIEEFFGDNLKKLSQQFYATTKKVTSAQMEVPLQKQYEQQLKEAYTENLDKYIQAWHNTQVLRLRKKVAQNVTAGFRAEKLIEDIQAERNTSYKHAKFLAKQETSLMVSKYREIRYVDAGLNSYIWSSSRDERTRKRHRELDKESRIRPFRFDQPPVVDLHSMRRGNPGEDYGCRCVAVPVMSDIATLMKEYATK